MLIVLFLLNMGIICSVKRELIVLDNCCWNLGFLKLLFVMRSCEDVMFN